MVATLPHYLYYPVSCKAQYLVHCCLSKGRGSLYNLLGTISFTNVAIYHCTNETLYVAGTFTSKSDDPQQYLNVLVDLNTCACSHITSYLSKHNKQNFEFVDLDIDKEIEGTDPKLWEAICLLSSGQHLKEEAYLKLPTHHHEPTTPKKSDALTFTVHSCFALMMTI